MIGHFQEILYRTIFFFSFWWNSTTILKLEKNCSRAGVGMIDGRIIIMVSITKKYILQHKQILSICKHIAGCPSPSSPAFERSYWSRLKNGTGLNLTASIIVSFAELYQMFHSPRDGSTFAILISFTLVFSSKPLQISLNLSPSTMQSISISRQLGVNELVSFTPRADDQKADDSLVARNGVKISFRSDLFVLFTELRFSS